ncbi:MAG: hypothetical protein H6739_02495 [Alphaproteobacteria bacterium]|nr:hypothetical protein [Alphaproteobacteria bacterium]
MSVPGIPNFDPEPHFAPREAPTTLVRAAQVLTVVGVLSLIGGLVAGDPTKTRIAFLVNLVYFTGLSLGGLAFAIGATLTLARWSRPLKRIAEGMLLYMPVLWVLVLVFFLTGGLELYEWNTHPEVVHGHKAIWLVGPFMVGRQLFTLGLLTLLGMAYLRASLRPDLGVAGAALGDKAPAWWSRINAGFGDADAEVAEAQSRMTLLSPFIGIGFALTLTFFAFDVSMSLAPHWYSNMFGGWFFMSCFLLGMVWLGLLSLGFRDWLGITKYLKGSVYHDLGKLIFGFTMFWGYTFYAQLLPIWYGNMTEEIGFLLVRFSLEPWSTMTVIVGTMVFLIPFITLLSRGIKKLPMGFSIVLSISATGLLLERFLVIAPSVWTEATLPVDVFSIGITAGFLGGFLWVVTKFLSSVPAMPITDPYMKPNPLDVHAHSLDHDPAHAH